MNNRLVIALCATVLLLLVLFFLTLIFSLITQLHGAAPVQGVGGTEVLFAVRLTLVTATMASVLALLVAVPVSYILARFNFPLKDFVDALLYLPIVLSPIALGAMLLVFFNTAPGRFFEQHFFRVVFEVPAIIAAQFIVIIGLAVSLIKSTFEQVNPEYEHIATTLGASRLQTLTRVLLPLSARGIFAAFLLTWARAVGEFGATVTLAGATPMKTETLPVAIFLNFASANVRGACVCILISLALSLGILLLMRKCYAYHRTAPL
ncbi:MAG: ABC transporter permease [Candidatus Aureabacteria bacterium]|nr:ABC transporter permease [Candidatus Auribacterota bacterium]